MRCLTSPTSFGLGILLGLAAVPLAGQDKDARSPARAIVWREVCRVNGVPVEGGTHSLRGLQPHRDFVSGIMLQGERTQEGVSKAFAGFLETKYRLHHTAPECTAFESVAAAEKAIKYWKDDEARRMGETVETGWTGTP